MPSHTVGDLVDLSGNRALVTGGGSGIGRGTAELLGAAGAHVLVLDRDMAAARGTVDRIKGEGGSAEPLAIDVTVPGQVESALGDQPLEILVNAAGIIVRKTLMETTHEEWQRIIDVNLTGYFNVLKAAVPALKRARTGSGRIVQIASVTAQVGYGYPSYTAAKGGVFSMTRQLASELAPMGIRINSISPGVIETGINQDTLGQVAIRAATIDHTPLGRIGLPLDIAKAVLFLASDLGEFVTGTNIVVDGGFISAINWGGASGALQRAHESELKAAS
jgi:NAD(P)-dependent dehydrogenase (short-subunit alcohol dehydrogenase family)